MRAVRILVIVMIPATLASCADDDRGAEPQTGGDLEDVTWILDEASAADLVDADAGQARGTIRFTEGDVGGTAFCNIYGGTYDAGDAGTLTIQLGAMTEMACEEPIGSLETAYVAALGEVTGYSVGDGSLVLTRGYGSALTFRAEQPLPLVGTGWRLDGIATGTDAVSSTLAGTEATATFGRDGALAGNGSCNSFTASYTVDGNAIEIGPVASTKMACEPDVMTQEAALFDGLSRAASFEIEGATLTLLDADEAFLLSFVAPVE